MTFEYDLLHKSGELLQANVAFRGINTAPNATGIAERSHSKLRILSRQKISIGARDKSQELVADLVNVALITDKWQRLNKCPEATVYKGQSK